MPDERKNIFLAPRSNEQSQSHFKSTIADGIPYEGIKEHLDEKGREILSKKDKISEWGFSFERNLNNNIDETVTICLIVLL